MINDSETDPSVQVLLKAGAAVDSPAPDGTSPLVVAIVNAHWELAVGLLDKGANPHQGAPGGSPLHTAVRTRNPETVALPDAIPTGNLSSLDFIKALIARGASVNAQLARGNNSTFLSFTGATPLLLAAYAVDGPLIRLLIEKGADPKITNKDRSTALMAAAGLGYDEIAGACQLTPDAVRSRIHRARLQLRAQLATPIATQRTIPMRLSGRER